MVGGMNYFDDAILAVPIGIKQHCRLQAFINDDVVEGKDVPSSHAINYEPCHNDICESCPIIYTPLQPLLLSGVLRKTHKKTMSQQGVNDLGITKSVFTKRQVNGFLSAKPQKKRLKTPEGSFT